MFLPLNSPKKNRPLESGFPFSYLDFRSTLDYQDIMDEFMREAINQARKSLSEGGIPIGSVLVRNEKQIAAGHNKRVQENNPILHGEMDCLNTAGRQGSFKNTVIYSTLMPCYMCAGTIVQFKIPRVIVGESRTFSGAREFMEQHGVEVIDLDLQECTSMMNEFIQENPDLWNEDIGETEEP